LLLQIMRFPCKHRFYVCRGSFVWSNVHDRNGSLGHL
jgi:hypothetical protein